ncbi:unnamed protein product, partial [Discosporangium mesarthrocarpum]
GGRSSSDSDRSTISRSHLKFYFGVHERVWSFTGKGKSFVSFWRDEFRFLSDSCFGNTSYASHPNGCQASGHP